MPRISQMRNASGMNINLVTSDDYTTFDDNAVDFSIRFGNGQFGNNSCELLLNEQCQIIASPTFLDENAGFDPFNPSQTIGDGLLLDHGDPYNIGWMDWHLWHELTENPPPTSDKLTLVQSYPTMLDMVCAGEGISIGTIGIEDDLLASGKIRSTGPLITRKGHGYHLVYREEQLHNPSFKKLRAYLIDSRAEALNPI